MRTPTSRVAATVALLVAVPLLLTSCQRGPAVQRNEAKKDVVDVSVGGRSTSPHSRPGAPPCQSSFTLPAPRSRWSPLTPAAPARSGVRMANQDSAPTAPTPPRWGPADTS